MLTGQAKKDYQREYMRKYMRDRRANTVKTHDDSLRPIVLRPKPADETVKTQSVNPMMVGYVRP